MRGNEFSHFVTGEAKPFGTVHGMTEEARAAAEIKYDTEKGYLVDGSGQIANIDEKRIFNITAQGELITQPDEKFSKRFAHSSITRDSAIVSAGYISIKDGKITNINNESGHYRPTALDLYNAIESLEKKGANIFAEDCACTLYALKDRPLTRSLAEFKLYMNEMVALNGKTSTRVDALREERSIETSKIGEVKILKYGENESVPQSEFTSREKGKLYVHQFPKEQFDEDFQKSYCEAQGIRPEQLQSITLPDKDLPKYLTTCSAQSKEKILDGLLQNIPANTNILHQIATDSNAETHKKIAIQLLSKEHQENTIVILGRDKAHHLKPELPPKPALVQKTNIPSGVLQEAAVKTAEALSAPSKGSVSNLVRHYNGRSASR